MKKYIFALLSAATFIISGCDSVLERPVLTKPLDETYGKTDTEYRLYVNEAYPVYFVGYNSSWGSAYAPLRDIIFLTTTRHREIRLPLKIRFLPVAAAIIPATLPIHGLPNTQPATGTLPGYVNGI